MTDQELNIAIAAHCGWKHVNNGEPSKLRKYAPFAENGGFWYHPTRGCFYDSNYLSNNDCLPDYGGDLNAMATAEALLNDNQLYEYGNALFLVCGNQHRALRATARQRAEAFLKLNGVL